MLDFVGLGDNGTYIAAEGPGASVLDSVLFGKLESTGRNAKVQVGKVELNSVNCISKSIEQGHRLSTYVGNNRLVKGIARIVG